MYLDVKKNYKKYRWFITSSGKIVVGGKSAEQNDFLLKDLKESKTDLFVLHTDLPGSPFSIILEHPERISEEDMIEAASFTSCFSQQWKKGNKSSKVGLFKLSSMQKDKSLKIGTWKVNNKLKTLRVKPCLYLTKQKLKLRSVPFESSINSKILKIVPGKRSKEDLVKDIFKRLDGNFSKSEIESAIPVGGNLIDSK